MCGTSGSRKIRMSPLMEVENRSSFAGVQLGVHFWRHAETSKYEHLPG